MCRARRSNFPSAQARKRHEISVRDKSLARVVRIAKDLPGQDLFIYEDEDGTPRDVTSQDVNAYLREITGADLRRRISALGGHGASGDRAARVRGVRDEGARQEERGDGDRGPWRACCEHADVCRSATCTRRSWSSICRREITNDPQRLRAERDSFAAAIASDEAAVLVLLRERLKKAGEAAAAAREEKPKDDAARADFSGASASRSLSSSPRRDRQLVTTFSVRRSRSRARLRVNMDSHGRRRP